MDGKNVYVLGGQSGDGEEEEERAGRKGSVLNGGSGSEPQRKQANTSTSTAAIARTRLGRSLFEHYTDMRVYMALG